ncbi:Exosome complex component Csl4 [ANME-1 cluster archaeon GoMg2]|jgi:exosome complex component CSL4|nr:Exosome complex component Csl4 [ANME-1 cluster archaeon GoMg2]
MESDKGMVLPGDFLGTSEEYILGNGVYDEEGNLYALHMGDVNISDKRVISILPKVETPPTIKEGDVVIAQVGDIKDTVAIVNIACVKGHETREIAMPTQGVIHISNVRSGYVKELRQEFGYLDIVKAKVVDAKALRLSTEGNDLGVVRAICAKCKGSLKRKGETLSCDKCDRIETRNLSDDYGKGVE